MLTEHLPLNPPADYSATPSATSTKPHRQIKFIFYTPSNFSVLALHCVHLKVSIYTCCGSFYFYQSYDTGAVSILAQAFMCPIALAYRLRKQISL